MLVTWPLTIRITTHLPEGTDTLLHYWNGWWVAKALSNGLSPYFTSYLFYPNGISLVYNNFAWIHIGGWLMLKPILGSIAAYNIVFLLNLALCGLAAYLLAIELIKDRRVAFIAGFIYLAWPYRLTQPSHPNLVSTWAIPIFILFLCRALKKNRLSDSIFAGLALALVGYTRWQLLIPALLVGGLFTSVLLLTNREKINRRIAINLTISVLITLFLLMPPILLLLIELNRNPAELVLQSELLSMQTDLLAYLTPASWHPLLGKFTQPLYEDFYPGRGSRSSFSPYIGIIPLLLVLLGLWKSHRNKTLPLLVPAIVLIMLALGPVLRINGHLYEQVPMPYSLANKLPIIGLIREPDRFNMFLALPIAMLAAYGMIELVKRSENSFKHNRLLAGLFILILLEYIIAPMPIQSALASPAIREFAKEDSNSAVLNIPLNPFKSKPFMFAQTFHERPILQGHASRYPDTAFNYFESQPFLQSMMAFDELPPKQQFVSRQLEILARQGIDHIIIDKHQISPKYLEKWRNYLAIKPILEDEDVLIYRTSPLANQDYAIDYPLSPGIGLIAVNAGQCSKPAGLMAINLTWGTAETIADNITVRFQLHDETKHVWQSQSFNIRTSADEEWSSDSIVHDSYSWVLPADLPPGHYIIAASLGDATPIPVSTLQVTQDTCEYMLPASATSIDVQFDDSIRLLAYNVENMNDDLLVTLYWLPITSIEADYKIFVHVFDLETNIPVAQHDAMPRNWSYPTSYWGLNELISDSIEISLAQIPSGEYGLATGLYDSVTGERLVVTKNDGRLVQDGRLVLPIKINIPSSKPK